MLTAELIGHVERAMRHDDATRDCMLAALEQAKQFALVANFADMQVEMRDWTWHQTGSHVWITSKPAQSRRRCSCGVVEPVGVGVRQDQQD